MTAPTPEAGDVAHYAAAVRAALADLPPAERDDLIEDLADHLAEVAAESDVPLAQRLGSPQDYAEELRASAGLGPRRRTVPGRDRVAGAVVKLRSRPFWRHPACRASTGFLVELRPAWWVARAWLAVYLLAQSGPGITDSWRRLSIVPDIAGSKLLGLLLLVGAIVGSVWLGRRRTSGVGRRAERFLIGAGNTVAVIVALGVVNTFTSYGAWSTRTVYVEGSSRPLQLSAPGGAVTNIYPYASDGTPLAGVLLFDQDGQPIEAWSSSGPWRTYFPVDANEQEIRNAYPLDQRHDEGYSAFPSTPVDRPRVPLPPMPVPAVDGPSSTDAPPPES